MQVREMGEGGQKAQTSRYKIHLSSEDLIYSKVTAAINTILYLKVVKAVDLESSHHRENV